MDKYCKNFTGGHCEKTNANVPRAWCIERCKHYNDMPPLAMQAKSFAKAVVKQVAAGNPKRTDAEVARIKEICKACDQYSDNNGKPRCKKCGCKLNVKNRWETADCPLDRWFGDDVKVGISINANIGDIVCTEPFIRWYKEQHPDWKIVVFSNNAEIFQYHPDVYRSMYRHENLRTNVWLHWHMGNPHRITDWPFLANNFDVPSGFDMRPRLHFDTVVVKKRVVIATGSTAGCKTWEIEKWKDVVNRLHQKGYSVTQIGAENWDEKVDGVDSDIRGQTPSLLDAAKAIQDAEFFIGVDSGPSHLAAGVGVKSIILFGPGGEQSLCHKDITYPISGTCHLGRCVRCRVMNSIEFGCDNHRQNCMSMTADDVIEQVERIEKGLPPQPSHQQFAKEQSIDAHPAMEHYKTQMKRYFKMMEVANELF